MTMSIVKMIALFLFDVLVSSSASLQFEITPRRADIAPSKHFRIVGGLPCLVKDHPYMVSIRKVHNMKHFCGGTIISARHVLTAAHCVVDLESEPGSILAFAGLGTDTVQLRHVKKIDIPPSYSPATMAGDLSVLTMEQPFNLSDVVQPVAISPRRSSDVVKFCPRGLIIGWGITTRMPPRNVAEKVMRCAVVPVISYSRCQQYLNLFMESSKFCAIGEGVDACLGDSGGPMMCDGVQIGVISSGNGCGSKKHPGLYARVDYHLYYIKRAMNGQEKCFCIGVYFWSTVVVHYFFY